VTLENCSTWSPDSQLRSNCSRQLIMTETRAILYLAYQERSGRFLAIGATPISAAAQFQNEEAALIWIEARVWPNGPVCPFCSATGDRVRKLGGTTTRSGLHKCYACRKPFTVKVSTMMEASHIPAHVWLQAMHVISSSNQLHRDPWRHAEERLVPERPHPRAMLHLT
jgi:hypothetical protein